VANGDQLTCTTIQYTTIKYKVIILVHKHVWLALDLWIEKTDYVFNNGVGGEFETT